MYICSVCSKGFKTEGALTTHFLQCWREHNPNHVSRPAPCKGNITEREVNESVLDFFASFRDRKD